MKLLNELIYKDEYISSHGLKDDIEIENVTAKQDEISEKTLFVLLKSITFDVNNIINYVIAKKPAVLICECDLNIPIGAIPIIRVENARKTLSSIFYRFYEIDGQKTKFIGITGTNGKTTTATILKRILEKAKKRVGFIGTGVISIGERRISPKNYSMTTPDPDVLYSAIRSMQESECEYIVMEVSSHSLYFEKTAPIPFAVGVFTNFSREHMDFHKSEEEYYKTKMKLFSNCDMGIFNTDDAYGKRAFLETRHKKISIGISGSADVTASDIKEMGLFGNEFIYCGNQDVFKIKTALSGTYNLYNILMAVTCALFVGIDPATVKHAASEICEIEGRLEIIRDEITVIIDYAHTEEAMKNALKTIYSYKNAGQKITTVFGCGGDRYSEKRPLMASVAEKYSDKVIVTEDNSRNESLTKIINDILLGFSDTAKREIVTSRAMAIEKAILSANAGDIVAVIGKGHERYNIDKDGYHDFDERRIIKNALKKRSKLLKDHENRT